MTTLARTSWFIAFQALVAVSPVLPTVDVGRAAMPPCPAPASLTIAADNRSADETVLLTVSGSRLVASGGCDNTTTGYATAYTTTLVCSGTGPLTCGRIAGLAPGQWVHRVSLQVGGSPVQRQAQRSLLLAGSGGGISNVVDWTVHGHTFVVGAVTDTALVGALDAAALYTNATARPALVQFDPVVFPGASAPQAIDVKSTIVQPGNVHVCSADAVCSDGRHTALCLEGSGITVDALDDDARPGGVVLRVGSCSRSLLRVYGSDDVLRGLVLEGSTTPSPTIRLDTIAFGNGAQRSRLEQCVVHGPTLGDGVSVEAQAGHPVDDAPADIVVADSEISGATDKGVKVDFGGVARIERSCIHDNSNGGVQATLGGSVTVIENVVQHNVGGAAENGLFVGVPNPGSAPNVLVTRGNVIRFNGARGVSIVDTATAVLESDVVVDNYQAGIRVESVVAGEQPKAIVRGSTFGCNFAPGTCPDGTSCRVDDECAMMPCSLAPGPSQAKGTGASLAQCLSAGCLPPLVDFGVDAYPGRNAFTQNENPAATAPPGVNFTIAFADLLTTPAAGNQWEHCDVPEIDPVDPNRCYIEQVTARDLRTFGSDVPLGNPPDPRHGPTPVLTAVTPGRPRAGDLVRVYGSSFNAVDGTACMPAGLPADPCSAENPAAATKNRGSAEGTRVTVTIGPSATYDAEVHAVTPSMVLFKMPVDCFAAGTLVLHRGAAASQPISLCDPGGCMGRAAGVPCDDGDDICTLGEACTTDGVCAGITPDCDDGDACTLDACDAAAGCTHVVRPDGAPCKAGDACRGASQCQAGTCVPGAPASCDDGDACTNDSCDLAHGCVNAPREGIDGIRCHLGEMQRLVAGFPVELRRLGRKLSARITCAARRVEAADAAQRPRTRRRLALRTLRCVTRHDALLARSGKLGPLLRASLDTESKRTRATISATFGLE